MAYIYAFLVTDPFGPRLAVINFSLRTFRIESAEDRCPGVQGKHTCRQPKAI
jgi:hypothetical protein